MDALPPPAFPPILSPTPAPQPDILATTIASSSDKLFFISYLPAGTACPHWYLVHIDLALTASDPACAESTTLPQASTRYTSCSSIPLTIPL
jgi:hypothetical protein